MLNGDVAAKHEQSTSADDRHVTYIDTLWRHQLSTAQHRLYVVAGAGVGVYVSK